MIESSPSREPHGSPGGAFRLAGILMVPRLRPSPFRPIGEFTDLADGVAAAIPQ